MRPILAAAILFLSQGSASAHRLDEYLQGTLISVEKNRLQVQMTLTPGVAVFPLLIRSIDTNADGVISDKEQRAYADQVLRDLSLVIDGERRTPQLLSARFSTVDEMKEGRGEIQLNFGADLPRGGHGRKLVFENHHQSQIAAYQVNCLAPRDPDIRIEAQKRNYSQSVYQLEYVQADIRSDPSSLAIWSSLAWLGAVPLLLLTRLLFLWRRTQKNIGSV
jgi:hypothetical protein